MPDFAPLHRIRRGLARFSPRPKVGAVEFGDLDRTEPFDRNFGENRGTPIDRRYIESFLESESTKSSAGVIKGRILEIGDDLYGSRFGGDAAGRVEVLDVDPANGRADFVADLVDAPNVPSEAFDCVICTQTLLLVLDLPAAIQTLHRVLKPNGVLLLTVPGISQTCRSPSGTWTDHWRFTEASVQVLLATAFGADAVKIRTYGNVKTAAGFLYGLAEQDLRADDFDYDDPDYPVIVAARALKTPAD